MEIQCSDLKEILKIVGSVGSMITGQCPTTAKDTPVSETGSQLCDFIVKYLPKFPKDECVSFYTGIMQCVCTDPLSNAPKNITISAETLDALLDAALKMSEVTAVLKKYGITATTRPELCQVLANLFEGDWNKLAKLVIGLLKNPTNETVNLISKYITSLCNVVCVGVKPKRDDLPVENNAADYNWTLIMAVVAAIVLLALIPMLCVVVSKSTLHKLTYYLVILAIVSSILVSVFVANPACLFKTCYVTSDKWIPTQGQYTGSGGATGLDINISLTASFIDSNTVSLEKLTCNGALCNKYPDLLVKCKSKATAQIDTKRTKLGYEITGDCIDSMKALITRGTELEGIFLVQSKGDLYVQVKVIFRGLAEIFTTVKLTKVS